MHEVRTRSDYYAVKLNYVRLWMHSAPEYRNLTVDSDAAPNDVLLADATRANASTGEYFLKTVSIWVRIYLDQD
jgi:hypothetical protein